MGGEGAQLEVDEGSKTSVQLATLPAAGIKKRKIELDDIPTGLYRLVLAQ